MARLEIPSIVVHKGSRSQSRPESPTVVVRGGGMPSLPSSRQGLIVVSGGGGSSATYQSASELDMIDGNANQTVGACPTSNSHHRPSPSCQPDKTDTENKNFRNRVRAPVECIDVSTDEERS